jgi:diguanylate cyclase (GGDEF)-like protein
MKFESTVAGAGRGPRGPATALACLLWIGSALTGALGATPATDSAAAALLANSAAAPPPAHSPLPAPDTAAAKSGENPARALVEQGVLAMRSDPEASRKDAEDALKILRGQPDADLEIRARLLLCDYQAERDSGLAQQQIAAATALLPHAKRQGLRAGVLICQGEVFEAGADNARAMDQYEQAVTLATREHDDEMLAEGLFSRGYLLGVQGDYSTGLIELRRAEALFEKLNKPMHVLTTINAVAILYNRMGDYAQARHIYVRALKAQREAGLQREQAVTLYNLGRADENLRDWEAARQAYSESLDIARQINYSRAEAYALRGVGAVENASGESERALETLARADVLQRQTSDARLHAQIQLARGIALHKLQRLPESTAALEEALQVFRQANALGELSATYSELAAAYAEAGDWHAAYARQTDAKSASEKLLQNQIDQRFAALKVEFDTAAREQENTALRRENEANAKALAQGRSVRRLQATVIALTVLIAGLSATLAVFQRRNSLRMRVLAMTDELTGVPNRRAVLARLDPLLRRSDVGPCAILIIDIDHFKTINDHHGHPAGDEVLKSIAHKVRHLVKEPAFFGRLGGEEFLITLPETTLEAARRAAESFRSHIEGIDTTRWFDDGRRITASIGVATSTPGKDTTSTLLSRADAALYAAKRGGRNCVKTDPASCPEEDALVMDV